MSSSEGRSPSGHARPEAASRNQNAGQDAPRSTLAELARERAALWAQLQERRATDAEVADLRARVAYLEGSLSWRVTRPLRAGKAAVHGVRSVLERRRSG